VAVRLHFEPGDPTRFRVLGFTAPTEDCRVPGNLPRTASWLFGYRCFGFERSYILGFRLDPPERMHEVFKEVQSLHQVRSSTGALVARVKRLRQTAV
jgi:hypothetical protein